MSSPKVLLQSLKFVCDIWGSNGGQYQYWVLVGFYAMQFGEQGRRLRVANGATAPGPALEGARASGL